MLKQLLTSGCLLWILAPSAFAQSADRPAHITVYSDDVVFENLCAPEFDEGLYEEPHAMALAMDGDDNPLAKVRIGLLERGFDPGFDLGAVDADEKLTEAIRGFQAVFSLPVTGHVDAETLSVLRVS